MSTSATLNNRLYILDVGREASNLAKLRITPPREFWYANSMFIPLGAECARAWLLMSQADVASLDTEGDHTLTIDDTGQDSFSDKVEFRNLVFIRATRLIAGQPEDPDSPYLVELADRRWLLHNPTYCASINKQYNLRGPGIGGSASSVYISSKKPEVPPVLWTWSEMIEDLWTYFEGKLDVNGSGDIPGTVHPPHDRPWDFQFVGVSAWLAYNSVLDRIGQAIGWDYQHNPDPDAGELPYNLFALGEDPSVPGHARDRKSAELMEKLASRGFLIHDDEPVEGTRARLPFGVNVHFHRVWQHGTEESVDLDSAGNWHTNTTYVKQIDLGVGGEEDIYHPLWDDLPCYMLPDNTISNQTDLDARAQERADQYTARVRDGGELMYRRFAGIWQLTTDGKIKGVAWKQNLDGGWITEVVRHSGRFVRATEGRWEVVPNLAEMHFGHSDRLRAPDLRPTYPAYPSHGQVVEITGSPDGSGYYTGTIKRWSDAAAAWVDDGTAFGIQLPANYWFGRFFGYHTNGSGTFAPVFAFYGTSQVVVTAVPQTITGVRLS